MPVAARISVPAATGCRARPVYSSASTSTMSASFAIIGAGAVGGLYGMRLAAGGHDVHFLMRGDYDYCATNGLSLSSPLGDVFISKPNIYRRAAEIPACDYVVLATKTTASATLGSLLPPWISTAKALIVLQNGLGAESAAASVISGSCPPIVGGLCFVCSNRTGPGKVLHSDYGKIIAGEHRPDGSAAGMTPLLQSIGELFESAAVPCELSDDLVAARWRKQLWNVPFNALSAILQATTDEIMSCDALRDEACAIMQEVMRGAAIQGRVLDPSQPEYLMRLTREMKPYKTSMQIDAAAGRELEHEAILGSVCKIAHAAGVELPRIRLLYCQLDLINRRMLAGRALNTGAGADS